MTAPKPNPNKIDALPTNHYFAYWIITAAVTAVLAAVVLHYLKTYDPLGKLPGVERHPDQ